jgi:glycosyltransferase involved in cell wall biosynthesis
VRIVGTNHAGYANDRNIAQVPMQRYRVVRANNAFRLANYAYFKLRGRLHTYFPHLHWDGGVANYDLLHFFNGISLGRKPWLSTFETYLPRWGAYGGESIAWGLRKLAAPACKRLIALSHCTAAIQDQFLGQYPEFAAQIMAKVSVLHPPQAPLLSEAELDEKLGRAAGRESIQCLLVGADFFRKGGLEVLMAMDALLQSGADLQLTIVSTLNIGDYASQATSEDLRTAMQIIDRHPRSIRLHRNLPNAAVLQLARQADIGLLPTWADTYGYAALEFMAAGCPVITTDIRALPEINGPDRGWLIACEKDAWGNAMLDTLERRRAFGAHLHAQLLQTFTAILEDRSSVALRGRVAFNHIRAHHSPTHAAAILEGWYDEALGQC